MHESESGSTPSIADFLNQEEPRRGFFAKALATVVGGVVGIVPVVTGFAVFIDPLRRKARRPGQGSGEGADDEGFIKVATLDALLVDGAPRRYEVIDDRTDAWNLYPREAVGAVYLIRPDLNSVRAFNVKCPHAGCSVDFNPDQDCYQCPCHDSSFRRANGKVASETSPSPRGMDELAVKIKDETEVWVKYQEFLPGRSEQIAD